MHIRLENKDTCDKCLIILANVFVAVLFCLSMEGGWVRKGPCCQERCGGRLVNFRGGAGEVLLRFTRPLGDPIDP